MTSFNDVIQLISIWGIVIPLVIGLTKFKTAGFQFRLFIYFLLAGFFTDITMYALKSTAYSHYLPYILNLYSLIESCTFFWLVWYNAKMRPLRSVSKWLIILSPIIWLVAMVISWFLSISAGPVFDPFYEVSVAFLAGFCLLEMVENQNEIDKEPVFWIFLGMFFYCFSTFFVMGFLNTLLSQKIWFLNNIFNIISYLFYAVGFWKINQARSV